MAEDGFLLPQQRVIKCEVQRVMSILRSHTTDASLSLSRFSQEIPSELESLMLRAFRGLYRELQSTTGDVGTIDSCAYTAPFCGVLTAGDVSGVVAGVAIAALNKFLLYGFLAARAPRASEAVNRIVRAATQCRFEPTSAAEDELVLLRLLELLGNALRCGAGAALTDDSVWDAVQCAFLISRIDRGSHLLRRSGENTLEAIVTHVFSRAHEFSAALPQSHSHSLSQAYGAPVLTRILSWLASLADPAAHGRSTRTLGLELMTMVLETGGEGLARMPACVIVFQAQVCRSLIANARSPDAAVLALVLRTVYSMFASSTSLKQYLKVQLEVFLTSVHLYLADSPATPAAVRELALESLLDFTREPGLLADLYANFDCDISCANLFELLVRCLCRCATRSHGAKHAPLTSLHVLALEGVLTIVGTMVKCVPRLQQGRRTRRAANSAHEVATGMPTRRAERSSSASGQGIGIGLDDIAVVAQNEDGGWDEGGDEAEVEVEDGGEWNEEGRIDENLLENPENLVTVDKSSSTAASPVLLPRGGGGEFDDYMSASRRAYSAARPPRSSLSSLAGRAARFTTPQPMPSALRGGGFISSAALFSPPIALNLNAAAGDGEDRLALLRVRRALKRRMALAAARFNAGAKDWLLFAVKEGVLPAVDDAKAIARFLRTCPGLDRALIGIFISEPDEPKYRLNAAVREEFAAQFDFLECRVDMGLRVFLESFRLPGEAQKICRLLETFSNHLFKQSPGPLNAPDTAFVLSYSIIMLNTDLHNPQVKKKMTRAQFLSNNRGIDVGGQDVPADYLNAIFSAILEREIQMLPPSGNAVGGGNGVATAGGDKGGASASGNGGGRGGGKTNGIEKTDSGNASGAASSELRGGGNLVAGVFGTHWDGVLRRQANVEAYIAGSGAGGTHGGSAVGAGAHHQERDMFALFGDAALNALVDAFSATCDPRLLGRAAQGIRDIVTLAAHHREPAVANSLVIALARVVLSDVAALAELDAEAEVAAETREWGDGGGNSGGNGNGATLDAKAATATSAPTTLRSVSPGGTTPAPGAAPPHSAPRSLFALSATLASVFHASWTPDKVPASASTTVYRHETGSSGSPPSSPLAFGLRGVAPPLSLREAPTPIVASAARLAESVRSARFSAESPPPSSSSPLGGGEKADCATPITTASVPSTPVRARHESYDNLDSVQSNPHPQERVGAGVAQGGDKATAAGVLCNSLGAVPLSPSAFLLLRLVVGLSVLLDSTVVAAESLSEAWRDVWEVVLRLAISNCLPIGFLGASGGGRGGLNDVPSPLPGVTRIPSVSDALDSPIAAHGAWMAQVVPTRVLAPSDEDWTGGNAWRGRNAPRVVAPLAVLVDRLRELKLADNDAADELVTLPALLQGSRYLRSEESIAQEANAAAAQAADEKSRSSGIWSSFSSLFSGGAASSAAAVAAKRLSTSVLTAVAAAVSLPTVQRGGASPLVALIALSPTLSDASLAGMSQALATLTISDAALYDPAVSSSSSQQQSADSGIVVSAAGVSDTIASAATGEILSSLLVANARRSYIVLPAVVHHHTRLLDAAAAAAAALADAAPPLPQIVALAAILPPFFTCSPSLSFLCERAAANAFCAAVAVLSTTPLSSAKETVITLASIQLEESRGGEGGAESAPSPSRSSSGGGAFESPSQFGSSSALSPPPQPTTPVDAANSFLAAVLAFPSATFSVIALRVTGGVAALLALGGPDPIIQTRLPDGTAPPATARLASLRIFYSSCLRLLSNTQAYPFAAPGLWAALSDLGRGRVLGRMASAAGVLARGAAPGELGADDREFSEGLFTLRHWILRETLAAALIAPLSASTPEASAIALAASALLCGVGGGNDNAGASAATSTDHHYCNNNAPSPTRARAALRRWARTPDADAADAAALTAPSGVARVLREAKGISANMFLEASIAVAAAAHERAAADKEYVGALLLSVEGMAVGDVRGYAGAAALRLAENLRPRTAGPTAAADWTAVVWALASAAGALVNPLSLPAAWLSLRGPFGAELLPFSAPVTVSLGSADSSAALNTIDAAWSRVASSLAAPALVSLQRVLLAAPPGAVGAREWSAVIRGLVAPLAFVALDHALGREVGSEGAVHAWAAMGKSDNISGEDDTRAPEKPVSARAAFVTALRSAVDREIGGNKFAHTVRSLEAAETFIVACATLVKALFAACDAAAAGVELGNSVDASAKVVDDGTVTVTSTGTETTGHEELRAVTLHTITCLLRQHAQAVALHANDADAADNGVSLTRDAIEDTLRKLVLVLARGGASNAPLRFLNIWDETWTAVSRHTAPVLRDELRILGGLVLVPVAVSSVEPSLSSPVLPVSEPLPPKSKATITTTSVDMKGQTANNVEEKPAKAIATLTEQPSNVAPPPPPRRGFFRHIFAALLASEVLEPINVLDGGDGEENEQANK